ncbi:hypothetical protein LWI28_025356 [Acer negundo]|uniref:Uncharacterized protein n=1 Tax=Acer negundo TaxID=4023 RepID=A0AAD5NLH0_ACENE|nr:hypothetical protein LWI28_025356 [Acer negundo]
MATTPTLFLDVNWLQSRSKRQFLYFQVVDRVLIWFKSRVLTLAQLRNLVITILRYLPEFDEGDQRSPEKEESVRWSGDRFWEHECDKEDPKPTPIKANTGSDLVSPSKLNLSELEGDEPKTKSLVTEIKLPDSEITTYLVQTQEATIEATSEAKNTNPRPKPDPNRNSKPTLSYPNPMLLSIQT